MAKNKSELTFKVERSNNFNQLNPKSMSLTEIRLLAIYQAKINARNPETRTVVFPLKKFCDIMEIKQLTVTYIKDVADSIICKPVHLPSEKSRNGFMAVPLFSRCEVYQKETTGEWLVELACHEKVLPYMFEMKKNYFTYELWNALKLKSVNQVRMYEILKQYEKIGTRTIKIEDLREFLGIEPNQYKLFKDFRVRVLEPCQKALAQHTDIKFDYTTTKGAKGKILSLKFNISKNKDFKDNLKLKEFICQADLSNVLTTIEDTQKVEAKELKQVQYSDELISLNFKLNEKYTLEQLQNLYNIVTSSNILQVNKLTAFNYIVNVYSRIKASGIEVRNLYKYTLGVITKDVEHSDQSNILQEVQDSKPKKSTSYDLEEYKDFIRTTKRKMS